MHLEPQKVSEEIHSEAQRRYNENYILNYFYNTLHALMHDSTDVLEIGKVLKVGRQI